MPPSAGLNEASSQAGYTLLPAGFKPKPARTIGRVYCDLLKKVAKQKVPPIVKPASAAELPAIQQPVPQQKQAPAVQPTQQPVRQDTGARRPPPKRIMMGGSAAPVPTPAAVDTTVRPVPPVVTPTPQGQSPAIAPVAIPPASGASSGFAPPPGTLSSAVGALDIAATVDASRSRMQENRTTMNRYGVEIQKKFALSAACVVFVLIGAPIALRFPRGGVGLVIGVSLGVFAIYYVGLIAGESLADRAFLTPFWAMWAANVILTIVGLILLSRMGKEGATSRGGDLSEFTEALKTGLGKIGRRLGMSSERRKLPS
jgi:lipopolysaccharide export system permease protein